MTMGWQTARRAATSAAVHLFFAFMALIAILPFVYMAFTSLRQVYSLVDFDVRLSDLNINNYRAVFDNLPFMTYFTNSAIVVVLSCALNILVCAMAGFGFAKKKFRGRDALFFLFLSTMMIPGQVTIIPVFVLFNRAGLLDSYAALILPTVGAFGVFMMRQFMQSLPDELLEAAQIDGCGEAHTFVRIVFPLIKPVILSLTIFTFIGVWNDFLWPLGGGQRRRAHHAHAGAVHAVGPVPHQLRAGDGRGDADVPDAVFAVCVPSAAFHRGHRAERNQGIGGRTAMEKVRWGVLGAGGIADRRTLPGMKLAKNAEVYAVMEVSAAQAEALREKYGAVKAYSGEDELLSDPAVQAVYIASPVWHHARQCEKAAAHGKHILVEKPVAMTAAESAALCMYSKGTGASRWRPG